MFQHLRNTSRDSRNNAPFENETRSLLSEVESLIDSPRSPAPEVPHGHSIRRRRSSRYEKPFASDVTERVKLALREHGVRTPDMAYRDLDLNGGSETPQEA